MQSNPLTILLLLSAIILFVYGEQCPTQKKKVVCYFASWGVYRPGEGTFKIEYLEPRYCTHVIYTFAGLSLSGGIDSLDYNLDLTLGNYAAFVNLKEEYPCVKLLLAIGGWNEGSEKYSLMAESDESRKKFAAGLLQYLVFFGFDGIDIDWEYPSHRRGIPADKPNFSLVLKALKERLSTRNRTLTVAISGSTATARDAYEVSEICKHADLLMVMAYDYHNSSKTSLHAPLVSNDTEDIKTIIDYYISNGCPANKLILGVPAYGRTFTLKSSKTTGLGAPITSLGDAGPFTQAKGFLGYNEICEMIQEKGWKTEFLKPSAAKYAWKDKLWVCYDDVDTVLLKTDYINSKSLGGMMFWSVDTDDFRGNCHNESYPLLVAANKGLGNTIPY